MKNLSKKDLTFISLMLFSMFFGAGNLIFPPFLGQAAGYNVWFALAGFLVSAVGLPILAIVTISKTGGLHTLASRVHPKFAVVFTILIYLSIGPFLGIPRAGSLAFEMGITPFLSDSSKASPLSMLLFTLIYFGIALWLCFTPSKLVDRLGKFITPILLLLIATIFLFIILKPIGPLGIPSPQYEKGIFVQGFLDGYMTMDAIAALNFGIVISSTLLLKGIEKEKERVSYSIGAGLRVGVLLSLIYAMLAYVGATSQGIAGDAQNGAETLTSVVLLLFGENGVILLGLIFTLACLTTSVGLITSCSQYFSKLIPKISYRTWAITLALSSTFFANMGLTRILSISVPILNVVYPMAIVLIILPLLSKSLCNNKAVYVTSMLVTFSVSIVDALNKAGFEIPYLVDLFEKLPFYNKGLGWLIPSIIGVFLGFIISKLKSKLRFKDTSSDSNYELKTSNVISFKSEKL